MSYKTDPIYALMLNLLRFSITNDSHDVEDVELSDKEWRMLYCRSVDHGILAVVWDILCRLGHTPRIPRSLRLQWAVNAENVEQRYDRQLYLAEEFAEVMSDNGIRVVALKGFSLSQYYPNPKHRECGDFDCYLCGDFEKGNRVAQQLGAHVDVNGSKHSHIFYKGLMIENHLYCMSIKKGDAAICKAEQNLQNIIKSASSLDRVEKSNILIPPPQFSAIFLTHHSLHHFLVENISLRHIYDWALLLKYEQNNIDWGHFYDVCRANSMDTFANTVNCICVELLGVELHSPLICIDTRYAQKVLDDILWNRNNVYNKSMGIWKERYVKIKNRYQQRWKYSQIYGHNVISATLRDICHIFAK